MKRNPFDNLSYRTLLTSKILLQQALRRIEYQLDRFVCHAISAAFVNIRDRQTLHGFSLDDFKSSANKLRGIITKSLGRMRDRDGSYARSTVDDWLYHKHDKTYAYIQHPDRPGNGYSDTMREYRIAWVEEMIAQIDHVLMTKTVKSADMTLSQLEAMFPPPSSNSDVLVYCIPIYWFYYNEDQIHKLVRENRCRLVYRGYRNGSSAHALKQNATAVSIYKRW